MMAAESGLRSNVLMELRYRHVSDDLENGTVPVAIQLEPRFHLGRKAAGYTFFGAGSLRSLRDCIEAAVIESRPDARLIPRNYYVAWAAIHRASRKAGYRLATDSGNISRTLSTMRTLIMRRR